MKDRCIGCGRKEGLSIMVVYPFPEADSMDVLVCRHCAPSATAWTREMLHFLGRKASHDRV
jgi:hypothetical protein